MSMRKIYKAINKNETIMAWIGNSADVPECWRLDPDSAKATFNPSKGEESHAVRKEEEQGPEEVVAENVGLSTGDGTIVLSSDGPRKRGRPRLVR